MDIAKASVLFFENQIRVRNKNRSESLKAYGNLTAAYAQCIAVLDILPKEFASKPGTTNSSISNRLSLIASFIQGIDICEVSISEAMYIQAAAILKQEIETISAILECLNKNRVEGNTPQVGLLPLPMRINYGRLNDIAHVGKSDVLSAYLCDPRTQREGLDDSEKNAISLTPVFDAETSITMYGIHVSLCLKLIDEMCNLFSEMYQDFSLSDEILSVLGSAMQILLDYGFVQEANDDVSDMTAINSYTFQNGASK